MSLFWSSPLGRVVVGLGVFTFAFWALAAAAFFAWSPGRGVAMAAVTHLASHAVRATGAVAAPATGNDSCTDTCTDDSYSYSTGSDDEQGFAWAVLDTDNDLVIDGGEPNHVRAYARRGQPLFWFRDDGDEFWVTDRALVDEARRATAPVKASGQEMGRVGAEMGRHGAAMGRVGGRMGSIGARLAMMEARLASNPDLSTAELEHQREMLNEMRGQLRELQSQLDGQRDEHERAQRQLSRRMSELSARHEAALGEARAKLREIATRARREGKAERPHANA